MPLTLIKITAQYILERDICPQYAAQLRHRIRTFTDHVGRDLPPKAVTLEQINGWLECLNRRAITVCGYRRAIIAILNYAADLGMSEYPATRRIRRPKVIHQPPQAFSRQEIAALIHACRGIRGTFPDGLSYSAYWRALIAVAYDTGLRRGDLFALDRGVVNTTPFAIVQHKTGHMHVTAVRRKTLAWFRSIPGKYPLQWRLTPRSFGRWFGELARKAHVSGSFRWIRRTSGSLMGHRHLGHRSEDVYRRHYEDVRLSRREVSLPPRWGG